MKYFFPAIVIFACLVSCHAKKEVKAIIFQRKEVDSNMLMVHFRYTVKDEQHIDSAIVSNTIINDTLELSMDSTPPKLIIEKNKR